MVLPEGLGGLIYRVRDLALRWVADRRGLVVPSLTADVRTETTEDVRITLGAALGGLSAEDVLADLDTEARGEAMAGVSAQA